MQFSPPPPTPTQRKDLRGYTQSIYLRREGREGLVFPASSMSPETATIKQAPLSTSLKYINLKATQTLLTSAVLIIELENPV